MLNGLPGFGKMGDILKAAQQIKGELERVKAGLKDKRVEASAGGGMVTAVANGQRELVRLSIEPEVIDANERELLEDLIVGAVNQALKKAKELAQQELQGVAGGLGLPGGMGLGPLGPLGDMFG